MRRGHGVGHAPAFLIAQPDAAAFAVHEGHAGAAVHEMEAFFFDFRVQQKLTGLHVRSEPRRRREAAAELIGQVIQGHAQRKPQGLLLGVRAAWPRPQSRGHAALIRERPSQIAMRGGGQQVHGLIQVALAAAIGTGQHIDAPQVEANVAHGAVAGDVEGGDGHEVRLLFDSRLMGLSVFRGEIEVGAFALSFRDYNPAAREKWWK